MCSVFPPFVRTHPLQAQFYLLRPCPPQCPWQILFAYCTFVEDAKKEQVVVEIHVLISNEAVNNGPTSTSDAKRPKFSSPPKVKTPIYRLDLFNQKNNGVRGPCVP